MSRTRPRSSFLQSLSSGLSLPDKLLQKYVIYSKGASFCSLLLNSKLMRSRFLKKTQSKQNRKGSISNESTTKYLQGWRSLCCRKIGTSRSYQQRVKTYYPNSAMRGIASCIQTSFLLPCNGNQLEKRVSRFSLEFKQLCKEQHVPEGDR